MIRQLLILLMALIPVMMADATEPYNSESIPYYPILHIDALQVSNSQFCVYQNSFYSEGAEIMMSTQRFFRCERLQHGKTNQVDNYQLRWVPIEGHNGGADP